MKAATVSSLVYSTDADPGIERTTHVSGFVYLGIRGRVIRSRKTLARIGALAIPPAWVDVWICADPKGHLQATGKDARGRKQYLYHAIWTAERGTTKFDSLYDFARKLPSVRRNVARDLSSPRFGRRTVLAAIVRLMDRTFIRVGSERYRRENSSFGATTLRNQHARVSGSGIVLDFRGKSGKRHRIEMRDRSVAMVVRRCLDFPGPLFKYRDADAVKPVSASDVNLYLREISGATITSKDFRTWGGTVCALLHLDRAGVAETKSARRANLRDAILSASRLLGNTAAVCRSSYIHPAVLTNYHDGVVPKRIPVHGLRSGEQLALGMLAASRSRRGAPGRTAAVAERPPLAYA
jgi:DNA topoisomerase I